MVHVDAPYCASFDAQPRAPRLALPALSCDCHAHICGPEADYDYAPQRIYTPPDALSADYEHMLRTVGVERAVLVQPSIYGTDNAVLMEAMRASMLPCRGVAVIDAQTPDDDIERLHEAGVRGARFNLVDVREPGGAIPLGKIEGMARYIQPRGWHAEFLIHVDDYPELDRMFENFPVPIVFGHLGYTRPDAGVENPGFQALLRLLKKGNCWVKLTGPYRISANAMPYNEVTEKAHALVNANSDRVVWGTDWPHVMTPDMPNDGDIVDLLDAWIPDETVRRKVLVDNPAALYGF